MQEISETAPGSDLLLHLRNIVVLLPLGRSQYSLFLHLIRVPSSFTEGGTLIRLRICEASRLAQYKMFVLCPVEHKNAASIVGDGVLDVPPGTKYIVCVKTCRTNNSAPRQIHK